MYILFGPPYVGKGTQAALLKSETAFVPVSTGDLVSKYATSEQLATKARGEYLSDEDMFDILKRALGALGLWGSHGEGNHVVLDGFPRTVRQAQWVEWMANEGVWTIEGVLNIQAPVDILLWRQQQRVKEAIAAGKEVRSDDKDPVTVRRRLEEYDTKTAPMLSHFAAQGIRVCDIHGERTIPEVHEEIMDYVQPQGIA